MGGENERATMDRGMRLGGVALVVFVAGAVVLSHLGGGNAQAEGPTDAGAIDICHQAVEEQLKAPATAEFGDKTAVHGNERYTVTGYVDADNSFGATLRLDWSCHATWTSGQWLDVDATVRD